MMTWTLVCGRAAARLFAPLQKTAVLLVVVALAAHCAYSASVRGVVTDPSGAKITGATVALLQNGKIVGSAVSQADGGYQILTGVTGRFFLVTSAKSFRQLETPAFYAGSLDSVERNMVLEPEWVRESIVVTATGTPTPQPQTSAATAVLGPVDLSLRENLASVLRMMPGTAVVQTGQRGAQTSLFIRGGDSDDNKILIDGVSAGDLGGRFDFGPLSATAVERAEVYRGTNSNLYGADAESGVVSLTTPRGTTSFPSLLFQGDVGNFNTSREELQLAGTHNKLDYLGAFSWLQSSNSLPNDEYHLATTAANLGWQVNGTTQIRGTLHSGVAATGDPGAWDFFHVADNATQKDQDIYVGASIDNQTTADFHNMVRYGLARKREQFHLWQALGNYTPFSDYCYGPAYLGKTVTITGANGYSGTGQAVIDCSSSAAEQLVSNRDELTYQGEYRVTPHLNALVGFHFEDERGAEPESTLYSPVERTNYDYIAAVHGDFRNRFFYALGGSLEHYSLFGVDTTPRAGITYYALRPRQGIFSGTRILFNYGDGVREPALTDQLSSLYDFLQSHGGQSTIQQLHISPLQAPTQRTYDGGVEQAFLSEHILFRITYFHNQFGRQIEAVGLDLIPSLLPNLSQQQQTQLEQLLQQGLAYEPALNSEAFKAQGIESTVEGGIGRNIFLRGGYTYLDAVVQRSFTNDDQQLLGPIPTFNGISVGPYSPLQGARPFHRPPHTGYISGTYSHGSIAGILNCAFASRSDDSTFLLGEDQNGGNSLLLPNRNLDFGYAKIDLGGSYQWKPWLGIYAQAENLTSNQHIAPIGYQSLPFSLRTGLRLQWGKGSGH